MTHAEYMKRWRTAHPEKVTEHQANYRTNHRESYNAYMREYMRRRWARARAEMEAKG